ncbi:MAG: hypothetical protein COA62_03485 [Rhodobiaceae bacterium]|nr:MAG: hypothetical protein COA62_03485 [Rhodobiaceae bacterium]
MVLNVDKLSDSTNTLQMTNNHAHQDGDNATLTIDGSEEAAAPAPSKRRLESRKRILAAARKLFVERGYHATRPQDISKLAGVGHGTFYLHFADKFDCFLSFAEDASAELEAFIEEHLADVNTLDEGIREVLKAIFEFSAENAGVLAAALTDINVLATGETDKKMPVDRWAEQWADIVRKWSEEGVAAADVDPMFAGHFIVGIIRQGGAYAHRAGIDQAEAIEKMSRAITRTLRPNN